jgi:hypothetical protein
VRACREEAEREAGIYHPEVIEVPDGWHTRELVPGPVPAAGRRREAPDEWPARTVELDGARPRLRRHVVWHLSPEFAGTGRPETVGMPYVHGGVVPGGTGVWRPPDATGARRDYYISPPNKPCPLSSLERRYLAALKTPPAVLGPPATFEEQVAAIRPEDAWRASGRVSMS